MGAGTNAFTLGETATVKAVFGVPDTVLGAVKLGQKQAIQTETFPQQFVGQVTAVAPQADQKSRTFQVEVTIPNSQQLLKSGMVATLVLGQAKAQQAAMVVPISAIVSAPDGSKAFNVFVVQHEGDKDVARRRVVTPGAAFGNMVAIASGLNVGERVMVNGATMVNDGQTVRVIQ